MKTAMNNPAVAGDSALREFVNAAREIESLLAFAAEGAAPRDAESIAAWIGKAQELIVRTGGWLCRDEAGLAVLKATPEFQEYREQLCLLYPAVESLRQELMVCSENLLRQQQQLTRARSWASTVGTLAANERE